MNSEASAAGLVTLTDRKSPVPDTDRTHAPAVPTSKAPTGLAWLVRLRWLSVAFQVLLLAVATYGLEVPFETPKILGVVAVVFLTNVVLATVGVRRASLASPETHKRLMGGVLVTDAALLTAILVLSGGPSNPFSVFYLVQVALAALLLDSRWATGLAFGTSIAFAGLFVVTPESAMHAMHHGGGFRAHLYGMWASYTLAAGCVGYFVAKIAKALEAREREVAELQRARARSEKLLSLSTLAAGAAHELGTPLGTIAVVAGELRRAANGPLDAAAVAEDAELLRREAERCNGILRRMAASAGQSVGEGTTTIALTDLVDDVRAELGPLAADVAFTGEFGGAVEGSYRGPTRALVQVLVSLVKNGLDAYANRPDRTNRPKPPIADVRVYVDVHEDQFRCSVADQGDGMSPATHERLGEPFFTTKPAGKGLGLGLFLARTFAESQDGTLTVQSTAGKGTWVDLRIRNGAP
ncbi:MAG: ATP-binding protein [Polyangiaceae bacterium]